eukprot:3621216-Amphidinium_carterae.2
MQMLDLEGHQIQVNQAHACDRTQQNLLLIRTVCSVTVQAVRSSAPSKRLALLRVTRDDALFHAGRPCSWHLIPAAQWVRLALRWCAVTFAFV